MYLLLFIFFVGVINIPNCKGHVYTEYHEPDYVHCYSHFSESFLRCLIAIANNKIVPGQ
jgi:hypothetical protein